MGLKDTSLMKSNPVHGFANKPTTVKGSITLPVVLGDGECTITEMVDFLVLDYHVTYNTIFGRPIIRMAKMVVITFCMMVKFPTSLGERYLKCDQLKAWECHIISLKLAEEHVVFPLSPTCCKHI